MGTRRPTEPLATVAGGLLALIGLFLALGVVATVFGSGSIAGYGSSSACVSQHFGLLPTSGEAGVLGLEPAVQAVPDGVHLCPGQPDAVDRLLATLAETPEVLVYLVAIALLVRVVRVAERRGPFEGRTVRAVAQLGWWLVVAGPVAAVGSAIARVVAADRMWTGDLGPMAWVSEVHVPFAAIITGAAVLTVTRILRIGAGMREEIEATV